MPPLAHELLQVLALHLRGLEERTAELDRRLVEVARGDAACVRLAAVTGIGPVIATALVATVGQVVVPISVQQTLDKGIGAPGGPDVGFVLWVGLVATIAIVLTGVAGMAAGAGVSLLMVLFCVRWGLDQIVIGIGITLLCEGATGLIFEAEFAESRPTLGAVDKVAIPGAAELPIVGGEGESDGSLFTQPFVVYLGLALAGLYFGFVHKEGVRA